MDISESFRVSEDITKPSDLFDFVVNPNDNISTENVNSLPQFSRSLKSLGIYLETASLNEANNNNDSSNEISDSNNNNNNSSNNNDECDKLASIENSQQKEQNNNHLLVTNGSIQYMDNSQSYWSTSTIKDDPVVRWEHSMLEDLNCWNHENGSSNSPAPSTNKIICGDAGSANPENDLEGGNTDGAIYTLTVLNGTDHNSTWYRLPENTGHENESSSANPSNPHHNSTLTQQTPSIDFDSLINNILPNSIHPLASSSSFPSYLTVNSQEIMPSRNPESNQSTSNQPATDTISSPIKPTEFIYEDNSFHESNSINSSRGTAGIPYTSSAENPNPNSSSNNSSSASSNNNSDWKLPTESNQSSSATTATSDSRVNSLLRNALQGKSSSFSSRYNGAHNIRSPHAVAHAVVIPSSTPASTKLLDKSDVACKDVATSVATTTTTTVSGFSDIDESMQTHSPLMAVSLEGGTVVMFDGGQGTGSMLVDSDNPSSAQSMDDIFLSQLDTVNYGEDYEKLKSIEHEVAKSVEQYCTNPYFTSTTHLAADPTRIPSISHHLDHALLNAIPTTTSSSKNSKKYAKRSSNSTKTNGSSPHNHSLHQSPSGNSNSGASSGGIRKERSLHYCTICHKGFKDKYSVNVHVRTHTGEKPFTCTFCGKNFRQKAHLAKHHHTHSVQKSGTSNIGNSSSNKPQNNKHR